MIFDTKMFCCRVELSSVSVSSSKIVLVYKFYAWHDGIGNEGFFYKKKKYWKTG